MPIRKAFPIDVVLTNLKANKRMTQENINEYEIQINIIKSNPNLSEKRKRGDVAELEEMVKFHNEVLYEINEEILRATEKRDRIKFDEFESELAKSYSISKTRKSMTEAANETAQDFKSIAAPVKRKEHGVTTEEAAKSLIDIKKKSAEDDGWLNATPVGAEREGWEEERIDEPMIEDVDLSGNADEQEYDSVDDFMLNNEIEYAKHKKFMETNKAVRKVFNESPVYVRLRKQIAKGIEKYNTPVDPDHYSLIGWFNHLQEEMTDGITYNEIIILKLNEVSSILKTGERASSVEMKHAAIEQALHVLMDGKE